MFLSANFRMSVDSCSTILSPVLPSSCWSSPAPCITSFGQLVPPPKPLDKDFHKSYDHTASPLCIITMKVQCWGKWLSMPGAKQNSANPNSCWDRIFFIEGASLLHLIILVLLTSFWCFFRIQDHHNKTAVLRGKIILSSKSHSCAFASDSLCASDKLLMFLHVVTDPEGGEDSHSSFDLWRAKRLLHWWSVASLISVERQACNKDHETKNAGKSWWNASETSSARDFWHVHLV